jgi:hypothetical protein
VTEELDDPLEPDAREQRLADKRLLESMAEDAQIAVFRDLLQDERVRDLMWRILAECGVYKSTFNRNFGDMALAEGRRQLGLWLLNEVCVSDPNAEMLMRKKSIAVAFAKAEAERIARQRPKPRT